MCISEQTSVFASTLILSEAWWNCEWNDGWWYICEFSSQYQWCSKDDQVMWAQHGHIQCVCNTHLLRNWGTLPPWKCFKLNSRRSPQRPLLATNTILSVLPVCSLHVHMKTITQANNCMIFDRSFPHYFYLGASEFYVGTGPGMPGCSYATA